MIMRLISIIFVFVVTGSSVTGNAEDPQTNTTREGNTLTDQSRVGLLQEKLQRAKEQDEKLSIVKGIAALNDSPAKQALVDYYKMLPPSVSTTDPNLDFFKVEVFEIVLPLLDLKERKKFVESALDDEVLNMRRASSQPFSNMYPMSLWKKLIAVIEAEGDAKELRDRFSIIAKDESLPSYVRSSALAASMRYELKKNKDTETQKIQDVLEHIPLKPESRLPWEYYDDYEKRRKYDASEEYLSIRNKYLIWRDSGQKVVFEGQLEFLRSHGLTSISLIVSMLERMDLPMERRHGLAEVAAEILSGLRNLSPQEREQADHLVRTLEIFIDKMPDKGAFCNRYYAILGLRGYYRNMGIKEGYPFKDGQLSKEKHSVIVTNSPLITTNRISGSGLPANTRMQQK